MSREIATHNYVRDLHGEDDQRRPKTLAALAVDHGQAIAVERIANHTDVGARRVCVKGARFRKGAQVQQKFGKGSR